MKIREALTAVSNQCDRASSVDGVGFNRFDTDFAKDLVEKENWTYKQEIAAYKMLRKYRRQLTNLGIEYDTLEVPEEKPLENPKAPGITLDYQKGEKGYLFTIKSPISEKEFVKSLPGRRWNPEKKEWNYLPTVPFMEAIQETKDRFEEITENAKEALNSLYRKSQEVQEKAVTLKSNRNLSDVVAPIKTGFFNHQRKAFELSISNDYCGYFMEQGTGKTLPAIATIGYRAKEDGVRKVLIIAPLSVLYEWKRQIKQHADFEAEVTVLAGESVSNRKDYLEHIRKSDNLEIILLNYDVISRMEDSLIKWKPDMVICDESQKIKSGKAQQSKSSATIGKSAKYRIIMTGTPITQSPLDIWSQYRFLDSSIFGRSYVKFRDRYAVMGGYMNKEVVGLKTLPSISGRKNLFYDKALSDEFTQKMYSISLRVTKKEAIDLPECIISHRYAKLEPAARKLYKAMDSEAVINFGEEQALTAPIVLTKLLRLQQICGGFIKPDEGEEYRQISSAKLDVLKEVLEETEGKIVVFAKFIPELEAIADMAKGLGYKFHLLTGKSKDRGSMIEDFQENPETKLFLAQIQTGGVGITLTAGSTAIFFSTGYSLIDYEQAKARIHRIGQEKTVNYIHILAEDTIDEEVLEKLEKKQDIATMSVDELRKLLKGDNEMARLPKEVEEVLNKKPNGGERFDSEIQSLLDEIEKDLEKSEKATQQSKGPLTDEEREAFFQKQRERKETEEATKPKRKKEEEKGNNKPKESKVSEKPKTAGNIVTLKDLGEELKMDPKEMRKWLRKHSACPESGRWEWSEGDSELEKIRKNIKVKP